MSKLGKVTHQVLVCVHKTCVKQGGKHSLHALKHALKQNGLRGQVMVTEVDCLDQCGSGPVMVLYPEGVWYGSVDHQCTVKLVERGILKGKRLKCARVLHEMPRLEPK